MPRTIKIPTNLTYTKNIELYPAPSLLLMDDSLERRVSVSDFSPFIGADIFIKLNGDNSFIGRLIDAGNDVLVIYNGSDFVYISVYHIQYFRQLTKNESNIQSPENEPSIQDELTTISLRKILNAAKGVFSEIYITGKFPIHGYVMNIMNDYFVFYSPIFKIVYVSLKHLKWLIPYRPNETPYGLTKIEFPVSELNQSLSRTLEEQLKKSVGKIIVFNFGDQENKIGKLIKVDNNQIELMKARMDISYLNMSHVQTIHFP